MTILKQSAIIVRNTAPLIAGLWFIPFFLIYFSPSMSYPLSLLYLMGALARIIFFKSERRLYYYGYAALIAAYLLWALQFPSNDREWQKDVAVLPYAEINGDRAIIRNIRNCNYRSEFDYDVAYYDKNINLNDLISLDLILVDWGLEKIVHTMFSFGFKDGTYLCISIETRKELGEDYSAIKGFFRQYELTYVLADERDLIGLRTDHRKGEDVYIYPLKVKNPDLIKGLFSEYLAKINSLHKSPEWYNALTENCMTSSYRLIRKHAPAQRWHWKVLMNGYVAEMVYDAGGIYNELPYAEVKELSLINNAAKACLDKSKFSRAIRSKLPGQGPNN